MDHADHVALLREGLPTPPATNAVWADMGAGTGAFTLALADLLGEGAVIYAVDHDARALRQNAIAMRAQFPIVTLHARPKDFTALLDLPPLDGIVMANSLHFVQHKKRALPLLRGYLKAGGRFILVEYNSDRGNPWVPFPLSFETWRKLADSCGLTGTRLLYTRPSGFLGEIYAALSLRG